MKKLLTLWAACLCVSAGAQINVGYSENKAMNKYVRHPEAFMEALKNTTTIFTLQEKDYNNLAVYENVIRSVWTFTPYKIIHLNELGDYLGKDGFSVWRFDAVSLQGSTYNSSVERMYYTLEMTVSDKKGRKGQPQDLAKIFLYTDPKTNDTADQYAFTKKLLPFVYSNAYFYDWGAGYLKGQLKTVNDILVKNETRAPRADYENKSALAQLKNDTLYVPDYAKIHINPIVRNSVRLAGKDPEVSDNSEAFSDYPFPIKHITSAELNEMILNRSTPFYYFGFVCSYNEKFVNVYRSDIGLIYEDYKLGAYNVKGKDIAKLADAIN